MILYHMHDVKHMRRPALIARAWRSIKNFLTQVLEP
jgi:hypothetical protein